MAMAGVSANRLELLQIADAVAREKSIDRKIVIEAMEDAIQKAKQMRPDLILMDVVMPGLNGFQATRAISRDADTRSIPIILCTSKSQETDKIWGMRQGARDYVVKPVNRDELLLKIAALG